MALTAKQQRRALRRGHKAVKFDAKVEARNLEIADWDERYKKTQGASLRNHETHTELGVYIFDCEACVASLR